MPSLSKVVLALLLTTSVAALPTPQLAGEGSACDSILSDTDNGTGYGIENGEDQLAGNIATAKGITRRDILIARRQLDKIARQLDKIAKGAQTVSNAAGAGPDTENTTTQLVNADSELTQGASNIGADTGSTEEQTLEIAGASVPKM